VVFLVSHSRPTFPFMPKELPFIGYIQDKCGPLLKKADITNEFTGQDLFVCLSPEHQRWLSAKNVPMEQTFVLPVPSDESMFFPLPEDHPQAASFAIDTSFVKHGTGSVEVVFEEFLGDLAKVLKEKNLRERLIKLFQELYRITCLNPDKCYYEPEMEQIAQSFLTSAAKDDLRYFLKQWVANFFCKVSSAAWRYRFLQGLSEAGIPLALYGNNWSKNKYLKEHARGPVDRLTSLNYVYNFTRINLSINQAATMTTRLVECSLAGGFIMAADHDQARDYLPARNYYEQDKELVFYSSPKDLVDRCRYYLEHEDARRDIAHNMRQRTLRERTVRAAAQTTLEHWRKLLMEYL
ncbi:MAG: glycosyltransferase family 1 protein, partial [Sedimentisphaerales bacterium]|nr:glycosyltransferase family 1 protein [Sedimentisphaerales bacterium]